jgi:hypothetical protein
MAARIMMMLLIAAMICPAALAQFQPTLPAPGSGGVFVGASSPFEQQLFNFVAVPVGQTVTPGGTQQLEYRFTLPVTFNNPTVPTDVTPVPNWEWRIRDRLGPDRNFVPPSSGVLVARDPRYSFTGRWHPVVEGQTAIAMAPGVMTLPAVVPRTARIDANSAGVAQIMPATASDYALTAENEITLTEGAMLIKGGNKPLYVLLPLATDNAVVRVEEGTFAMVSNFGGHISIANLADSHDAACRVLLTDRARKAYGEMPVRIGYMVEIYGNEKPTGEHRIASYSTLRQLRLSNGYTVETMRLNYPHAFKRFNLTRALSQEDFNRLVKTAAALAYLDRGDVL